MSNLMDKDILRVLITQEELQVKIKELGKQITEDYKDKNLLLVSVLKGSVVLMADLMRAIDLYCKIDFLNASSYGENTTSSGSVKIIKDLDIDVKGYDLLIVEDILDSGRTLNFIRKMLLERNAKSIRICTLLDKPERRVFHDVVADYVGFIIPDEFVVGYGLDYAEDYRNLSYIGALKPEVYTKI